ncbi:MAG: chemotaxis protein CheB [Nitrospira sp.]|nr:chemotaxis protein CheB [Nitrospira sp.]
MWHKRIHYPPISHEKRNGTINRKRTKRDIIVIGASAGGVPVLQRIFAEFPAHLAAAVGVVLHRSSEASGLLSVLSRRAALPVMEPDHPMTLKQGTIYLAPADHHLLFRRGSVDIYRGPREHSSRPSVNVLFRSAAEAYGRRVVGLLLTGCGEDGVSGLISITAAGGLTLAQDPAEAYMPYMPLNAIRYDDVAGVISLDGAAQTLYSLAHGDDVSVKVMAGS